MFVGRSNEIKLFSEIIERPEGQAIMVIGHSGMGKTSLLGKLSTVSENIPKLQEC